MLTRLIVDLYAWIIEIFLWLVLVGSAIAGFYGAVPILSSAGGVLENEVAGRIFGGILFPVATFLILVVLIGPFLVLVDIRKSVRALEATNRDSGSAGNVPSVEYREPHL